jgi:hypothetical protein
VLVAIALTSGAITLAIDLSLEPGSYFFYSTEDRAAWTYDPGPVAFFCGMMLVSSALTTCALVATRPRSSILRSLIALAIVVPWALLVTPFVIHAPGYMIVHHLWIWFLIAVLSLAALVSSMHRLYSTLRRRLGTAAEGQRE